MLIRSTSAAIAFLYVVSKACRQLGPERHKPTLTEFRVANKQRVPLEIDIFQFQPDRFANTQAKAVQEGEYHLIRLRPMRGTRPVRERTSQVQEALGVIEIEEIGNASCGGFPNPSDTSESELSCLLSRRLEFQCSRIGKPHGILTIRWDSVIYLTPPVFQLLERGYFGIMRRLSSFAGRQNTR